MPLSMNDPEERLDTACRRPSAPIEKHANPPHPVRTTGIAPTFAFAEVPGAAPGGFRALGFEEGHHAANWIHTLRRFPFEPGRHDVAVDWTGEY